jgi:membrane protease YdiL (CAAX protease family)
MTSAESPLVATATAPKPPRVWKFWGTLIWSLAFYGVMAASSIIGIIAVLAWYGLDSGDRKALAANGLVVAATSISAAIPVLLTVALAVKLARQPFRDYLALRAASLRHVLIGMVAIVILMVLNDTLTALAGRPIVPDVLIEGVRTAQAHNALPFYALALVVAAPITEEIVFRGFIYRGLAASRLGVIGAVIVSSLVFTAIHIQYDLITLVGLLATALLLGIMRAISGSTLLTIAMHALNNAVVLVEMLWFAGLLRHA